MMQGSAAAGGVCILGRAPAGDGRHGAGRLLTRGGGLSASPNHIRRHRAASAAAVAVGGEAHAVIYSLSTQRSAAAARLPVEQLQEVIMVAGHDLQQHSCWQTHSARAA